MNKKKYIKGVVVLLLNHKKRSIISAKARKQGLGVGKVT